MRHKPMLFHKLNSRSVARGRETVGLIGTHHGTGVTFTALNLAFYLGEELGRKTAYLECNGHHDMKLVQAAYEWDKEEEKRFSFHLVNCYREVTYKQIPQIFGDDYECLIMDFGTDFIANKEEFLRCSTKIIIGGRSEWELIRLLQFINAAEVVKGSDSWMYFIPLADDKTIRNISKEAKRRIWAVPAISDPTTPSRVSNQFFDRFF